MHPVFAVKSSGVAVYQSPLLFAHDYNMVKAEPSERVINLISARKVSWMNCKARSALIGQDLCDLVVSPIARLQTDQK